MRPSQVNDTPLHLAAARDRVACVAVLLRAAAASPGLSASPTGKTLVALQPPPASDNDEADAAAAVVEAAAVARKAVAERPNLYGAARRSTRSAVTRRDVS